MMLNQQRIRDAYRYLSDKNKEKLDLLADGLKIDKGIIPIYATLFRLIIGTDDWIRLGLCTHRDVNGNCLNRVTNMALYCNQCQERIIARNEAKRVREVGIFGSDEFSSRYQKASSNGPIRYTTNRKNRRSNLDPFPAFSSFGAGREKEQIQDIRHDSFKVIKLPGEYGVELTFNPAPQPFSYICQQYPRVVCMLVKSGNPDRLIIIGILEGGLLNTLTERDRSLLPQLMRLECS